MRVPFPYPKGRESQGDKEKRGGKHFQGLALALRSIQHSERILPLAQKNYGVSQQCEAGNVPNVSLERPVQR